MAGTFKKTMIYLGLADDDSALEDERRAAQSAPSREPAGSYAAREDRYEAQPRERRPEPREPEPRQTPAPERRPEARTEPREAPRSQTAPAEEAPRRRPASASEQRQEATVTPIKPTVEYHDEESAVHQITTIHPTSYNEAKLIGDSFRQGIPVIMNVTDIQESEAKRLVDFSAGLVFGLGGRISRVTNKVFLLTPEEVDVKAEGETKPQSDDDPLPTAH
ncbi:cell division protein SepF [Arthrobacter sp. UM1]|uniref:cell division protein SepF n=1 Tax=Arthrobacter sp. UM1 TaxID=2766776 RepID=UPI001CF6BC21|nr:cell division protein SepF [Arthrobacter sp. UM1]MCB4207696.1 cell division protein SepF [Arthrobacter sp. UM1]